MANETHFPERFRSALDKYQTVIISGVIGHERLIQIMQHLLGRIGENMCIAYSQTKNVNISAHHLATGLNGEVGGLVGCCTLLGRHIGAATRIKFFSDAFLLIEAMHDHALLDVSVIVLDQVNERSLATDLLLGYLKKLQSTRPELNVVIMGVGLYGRQLQRYFISACIISGGPPDLCLASQKDSLMKCSNVASVCLILLNLNENPMTFDYFEKPNQHNLDRARKDLGILGAIVDNWELTELGETLATLPLSPEIGYLLLTSFVFRCSDEAMTLCSMLAVSGLFCNPKHDLLKDLGDYLDMIRLEATFKKNPSELPLLLHKTGFTSVESLTANLEAARNVQETLLEALGVVIPEVDLASINRHSYINLTEALIVGRTNVEMDLVAGYADLLEMWPEIFFWRLQEF